MGVFVFWFRQTLLRTMILPKFLINHCHQNRIIGIMVEFPYILHQWLIVSALSLGDYRTVAKNLLMLICILLSFVCIVLFIFFITTFNRKTNLVSLNMLRTSIKTYAKNNKNNTNKNQICLHCRHFGFQKLVLFGTRYMSYEGKRASQSTME